MLGRLHRNNLGSRQGSNNTSDGNNRESSLDDSGVVDDHEEGDPTSEDVINAQIQVIQQSYFRLHFRFAGQLDLDFTIRKSRGKSRKQEEIMRHYLRQFLRWDETKNLLSCGPEKCAAPYIYSCRCSPTE